MSYRDVEKQVPAMHESGKWNCIVHLGVGPQNVACTIETGSSTWSYTPAWTEPLTAYGYTDTTGYMSKDVDGELAPPIAESRGIAGNEPRWESTLDCERCCQELNAAGFEVSPASYLSQRGHCD